MPYININEYDNTLVGPKTNNGNVVAIPINAKDGPSDRWITVDKYEDFIQMFGPQPANNSVFGSSWEYAANLLLREMPVCVRRITHEINEDGTNGALLSNVSTSKGVIKIKDIVGNSTINPNALINETIVVSDSAKHSKLNISDAGEIVANPNYINLNEDKCEDYTFDSVFSLLSNESIRGTVNAFADVKDNGKTYPWIATENEWDYIGKTINEHCKSLSSEGALILSDLDTILKKNQDGKPGDFYVVVDNEQNCRVDFVPNGYANPKWKGSSTPINTPDILINYTNDIVANDFIDVVYNATNDTVTNHAWNYTGCKIIKNAESTSDLNDNDIVYVVKDEALYTYSNNKLTNKIENINEINKYVTTVNNSRYRGSVKTDLPENASINDFVWVEDEKLVYVYTSNEQWTKSAITQDDINTVGIPSSYQYNATIVIPWIDSGEKINEGLYRHYFNWKLATGEDKNNFLTHIYWKATSNPIATRPHNTLVNANVVLNEININAIADVAKTGISLNVNKYTDISIENDTSENRLVSGKVGITNTSYQAIKIYSLKLIQKASNGQTQLVYNANLEKITSVVDRITEDPLLEIVTITGESRTSNSLQPKLDLTTNEDRWYIELEPGATLYYNRNLTGLQLVASIAVFDESDVVCHLFESSNGRYDVCLSTGEILEVIKTSLPITTSNDDINNLPISDGKGNFNLFTVEYKYPGTNGNTINVRVKTITNQGIYMYVYRNNQFLERIELCSFRQSAGNGRVKILDLDYNKDDIWRILLTKFGILLGVNETTTLPKPIYGDYVKISLNSNLDTDTLDYSSYDYIQSLYAQTGDQIANLSGGADPSDEHIIHEVPNCYSPLVDKYKYNVKFIANGGYVDKLIYSSAITSATASDSAVRLIEDAMLNVATTRKDCVAYLDAPFDAAVEDVPYYFEHISSSYAAAYDPWCLIALETGGSKWMPPSFVQLYTHAKSLQKGNKLYLPPAGVRRALVPEILKTNHDLPSSYITDWQNTEAVQFINPIIWINGYDYTIYGQKTLYNVYNSESRYQSALQNLNVRLVANEIKKLIFDTCINLTFELNNMMTWNEFKSKIEPTLLTMQSEGVLTRYSILMGTETMTSADLNTGHIVGTVKVAIVSAAIDWDINFEIQPNDITFYENDYNSSYGE